MIRIAFCDDDAATLNKLCALLDVYRGRCERAITCATYHSALDLLTAIEKGAQFDILFLDVLMPGENGIDTAAEIRHYDQNVKIIFLTTSSDFAVDSYTVGAYFYQLKPISEEAFSRLMDSAIASCEKEQTNSLILRCKNGITRIDLRTLEYCEVIHRTLLIHLTDGTVLESIGSLDDLHKQLEPYGGFLRPHRSYLVNLGYVKSLSYQTITLSCLTEIPIPRGKYKEVKDAYLEYAFRNRRVTV